MEVCFQHRIKNENLTNFFLAIAYKIARYLQKVEIARKQFISCNSDFNFCNCTFISRNYKLAIARKKSHNLRKKMLFRCGNKLL